MLKRQRYIELIEGSWPTFSVVALLGPRQTGKTTLAKEYGEKKFGTAIPDTHYFDLDDPLTQSRLANPRLALEGLKGLVIIDEIQKMPDLFSILRVLVDKYRHETQYLILGSASLDLVKQSSETLAGRIRYLEIHPFGLREVGPENLDRLWIRGGFPRSYLAEGDAESFLWRDQYVRTYLERDIPQLGFNIPATLMRRFWMMLTHYHGQIVNYSEIARSLDISDTSVRRYLDILVGTFMIRRLQPWFENIGKRQVKNPKIYFRDSGILHLLSQLKYRDQILMHPRLGASWEGFALEETTRLLEIREEECFFWAVHQQAELDLLTFQEGRRIGYEFKYTDSPRLTPSMHKACELLKLDRLIIVHPGETSFPLADKIDAVDLTNLIQ